MTFGIDFIMTELYPNYVPKGGSSSRKDTLVTKIKREYLRLELASSFYMLQPAEKIIAYMILFLLLGILLHHSVTIWHFTKCIVNGLSSASLAGLQKLKFG